MTTTPSLEPAADMTRRRFIVSSAALALLVAGVGAGCGSDEDPDATRQLTDALGPVDVPQAPERIVADSVSTLAHLWALGVVPIGAAVPTDISPDYIGEGAADVPNMVADDGWTLDIESALAADPDLIVAVGADYNVDNCTRYRKAAPTYCFNDGWASEKEVRDAFAEIAVAVGREDEAAKVVSDFDARKEALAARVADTDLAGKKVGLVRLDSSGFIGVRVQDLGAPLLEELGMATPDWKGKLTDGYLQLSMENLGTLNEADVLLVTLDDNVDPAKVEALNSPLWDRLDPVASGQAHIVSAWNGADFPQLNLMLDDIETTLVEPAESAS